jgi:putative transposase
MQFDKIANLHYVTTTITDFLRIFSINNLYCDIIIDSFKHQLKDHSAYLIAYVIMPSHLHFITYLPEGESISDFIRDFKKYTSNKIKKQLYKYNCVEYLDVFRKASPTKGCKIWMSRFDDYLIATEHMLEVKINYIHDNPRRGGLVEEITDWKYSSARNYYLNDNSVIDVGFPPD